MKDGDLWKAFQEAVAAKCPWAVWSTKVKGHATAEQVEAGVVKAADKEGNDKAEFAADRASKDEQRYLAMIAKLFSKRNKAYQDFVRRIQKFILNMKNEESELRKQKMREENPFGEKEGQAVKIEKIKVC